MKNIYILSKVTSYVNVDICLEADLLCVGRGVGSLSHDLLAKILHSQIMC